MWGTGSKQSNMELLLEALKDGTTRSRARALDASARPLQTDLYFLHEGAMVPNPVFHGL